MERASGAHVLRGTTPGWWGIDINIGNKHGIGQADSNVGTPVRSGATLRQAFAEAIDRDNLRARVVFGVLGGLELHHDRAGEHRVVLQATSYPAHPDDPKHAKALVAGRGLRPGPFIS